MILVHCVNSQAHPACGQVTVAPVILELRLFVSDGALKSQVYRDTVFRPLLSTD